MGGEMRFVVVWVGKGNNNNDTSNNNDNNNDNSNKQRIKLEHHNTQEGVGLMTRGQQTRGVSRRWLFGTLLTQSINNNRENC